MGYNKNPRVEFICLYCGNKATDKPSHFARKKRHFCSMKCYANFRKELLPKEEQHSWRGGVSQTESHRRWKAKNPERMAHLKARRYARERNAEGSHTFEEWTSLKLAQGGKCAICGQPSKLTKDHIIPLSKGGTDYISNIQGACRSCNSRKHNKIIYENPELL